MDSADRAALFKAFVSDLRGVDESIVFMPDLPEGCEADFVEEVARVLPVADNPYEGSSMREAGLKVWDSVYVPTPKAVPVDPVPLKDVVPLRVADDVNKTNKAWDVTKKALSMIGRTDGEHYLRPRGRFVLDVTGDADGVKMLQAAHILTHRGHQGVQDDDYTFGQTADLFLRNLVKLFLARSFGLKVNTHPESESEDSFDRLGIEVVGSFDLRDPVLLADLSTDAVARKADKTVAFVLGSVGVEASPRKASESTAWREHNKWSSLPTIVALAGWECVDFVSHSAKVDLRGREFFAAPCQDLQGMDRFKWLIDSAMEAGRLDGEFDNRVMAVGDWLRSGDFAKGLSVTPQLPCPMCLKVNGKSAGAVKRPASKRPKRPFKDIESSAALELKEWADYVRYMRNCVEIGRTATSYACGSVTSMERRNRNFKRLSELRAKVARLDERASRKMEQGFLSEAEGLRGKAEKARSEIERMTT